MFQMFDEAMQKQRLNIKSVEPDVVLKSSLHSYQKMGLAWMIQVIIDNLGFIVE